MARTTKKATPISGNYTLLSDEEVLAIYEKAGMVEEEEVDCLVEVDNKTYLFTGWKIQKNGEEYEFAIILDKTTFTEEEIESIYPMIDEDEEDDDEDDDDDDDDDENDKSKR